MNKTMKKFLSFALATLCAATGFLLASCADGSTEEDYAAHKDAAGVVAKKGVSVSRYNADSEQNGANINALDVSWWYNWSVRPGNSHIESEFVPMVWGANDVTEENLEYIRAGYDQGTFTHLLTFNEPDLPGNDGLSANMTVDAALALWPQLMEAEIPLSSPAVSYYSSTQGNAWLDEFMQKAAEKDYRVDFIAIHIYQSFYEDKAVSQLKETLDALYAKYRIPVWLTEFGAIDIVARDSGAGQVTPSCTEQNAQKYVVQVTDMLEQCGYVERYSWFVDNFAGLYGDARPWEAPYTTLYDDDDTISGTGETYRDVQSVVPLLLETTTLASAAAQEKYEQVVSVCGGTGNYTFSAKGLPAGLTMTKAGRIEGTPTMGGIYAVTVTVTDGGKGFRKQSFTHKFSLTVNS